MQKIKIYFGLLIVIILITGCDVFKTEKDELLFTTITELQNQVEQEEWDKALSNMNDFQTKYKNRKWKLQLLGELDDYKEIELELEKLKESLKQQEHLESKTGLSQINHRLTLIYNL